MSWKVLPQKLGIDFFGTLDTKQELFKQLTQSAMASGVEVVIISGAKRETLLPLLAKENYTQGKHFTEIITIPEFLEKKGYTIHYSDNGTYFTHIRAWWRAKGIICFDNRITTLIDSDVRYKEGFDMGSNRFVLNDYRLAAYMRDWVKDDYDVEYPVGPWGLGFGLPC